MITLKEVAAAANVSTVTASSVLSGVNRVRVAPATAERIRRTAKNMNYVPLAAARGLRTGRTRIISFVASAISHHHWDDAWHEALKGVSDLMWEREERLMLVMPRNREHELEIIRQMAFGRQVDGFIIQAGNDMDQERLSILNQSDRPFVMTGGLPRNDINCVVFDMEAFAETVIAEVGDDCGAVLLVLPKNGRNYIYDRFQAKFKEWAEARSCKFTIWDGAFIPEAEWLAEKRREGGGGCLAVVLLRGLLPEMIQALDDGGIPTGSGSRIVFVTTGEEVLMPPPGLSVVHFDNYSLGRRSAKLLMQLVDDGAGAAGPHKVVIPATPEV
ncbi:MAG: LacI family transcriptional regulator [Planctomycetota bacterium]|jgi:DNA-binding LacI/PurR family transcriptional regulator|nr:LacI family transcriptional regulator [Planctomycetota bacterium]